MCRLIILAFGEHVSAGVRCKAKASRPSIAWLFRAAECLQPWGASPRLPPNVDPQIGGLAPRLPPEVDLQIGGLAPRLPPDIDLQIGGLAPNSP
jgi:hypothetical protein